MRRKSILPEKKQRRTGKFIESAGEELEKTSAVEVVDETSDEVSSKDAETVESRENCRTCIIEQVAHEVVEAISIISKQRVARPPYEKKSREFWHVNVGLCSLKEWLAETIDEVLTMFSQTIEQLVHYEICSIGVCCCTLL